MRPRSCRGYCARLQRSNRGRRRCWSWMAAAPMVPLPLRKRPGCVLCSMRPVAGLRVVQHETRGRAAAINRGVQEAAAPIICALHADTLLPDDAVAVMHRVFADPGTALAG